MPLQCGLGITLKSLNNLRKPVESWENQSVIEYDENHFHVDWFTANEKEAFRLGTKTLLLLADKFETQNITGVRFLYSFQCQTLGQRQAIERNIHGDGDEYYISARLSFHRIRPNEEVVAVDLFNTPYYAELVIDI